MAITAGTAPLPELGSLQSTLAGIPVIVAVLDDERRIVFGEERILKHFGLERCSASNRHAPGDVLGCVHAVSAPGGCGTSEACGLCGAFRAIKESRERQRPTTQECRIQHHTPDGVQDLDLIVTASPYRSAERVYTLLTIQDAGPEKRKRALERVFFHDILNTAGGVSGLARIVRETDDPIERGELLAVLEQSARALLDEIEDQRQLSSAENGELTVTPEVRESTELLRNVQGSLEYHDAARSKSILIDPGADRFAVTTDPVLLRRVLINLTKNGLEASALGRPVLLCCSSDGTSARFLIHNEGMIPREVQLQLFQRSFSTKGAGRGLGTYSVRLLTERYLRGSVSFTTDEDAGTTFVVTIPLEYPGADHA